MNSQDESYPDLAAVISFEGFHFATETYRHEEQTILQPRLEALGYTSVEWWPGETDSFGPLSRLCKAMSPDGIRVTFIYG